MPVERVSSGDAPLRSAGTAANRALWRIHLIAGLVTMPVLVVLATTGLVMMYAEPLERLADAEVHTVRPGPVETSLDRQFAAVAEAFPGEVVRDITTSSSSDTPTTFRLLGADHDRIVAVDPYRATVLGDRADGDGVVALATRLHASLNLDVGVVRLPSLAGLLDDGPMWVPVPWSDVLLEVVTGWILVMLLSGLLLWWPRRRTPPPAGVVGRTARRWRRLHVRPGVWTALLVVAAVLSAMTWTTFWGGSLQRAAASLTPSLARSVVPSEPPHHPRPAIELNRVAAIARSEGFRPGYRITLPVETTGADGTPLPGSYRLDVPWPDRVSQRRVVDIDQFSGTVLRRTGPDHLGGLVQAVEMVKQTHVGTQFGVVSRIVMTVACVAVDLSAVSGLVLWLRRRRRAGGLALGRPVAAASWPRWLRWSPLLLGAAMPLWGASALTLWIVNRGVIRPLGTRRLRRGVGAGG